ncbi:hypothetical protein HAX54_031819, partial [Datura stramonium]|nr:hypothetical protein [Datura stramonium]
DLQMNAGLDHLEWSEPHAGRPARTIFRGIWSKNRPAPTLSSPSSDLSPAVYSGPRHVGRNPVRGPSLLDSLHQVIANNQLLSLGVKG